ncbi:hypothetical protein PVAG01_04471 [Phlyctema vagabunda]|uniref:Uncharacterized protein n=1 Tax=Phlyctema vagabunda TaxID=108571 RepID=A0ABR4PPE8_9HELO
MYLQSLIALVTATAGVVAVPLQSRAVVAHDSINPFPETVPNSTFNTFEPFMHIAHGCQVYSAVDGDGNTSGGLQDSGSSDGACKDTSKGQTYVRAKWFNGQFGIMYAWYWPKDHPIDGNVAGGHRHDWENVVVWIDDPASATPKLLGAAASGHGSYVKTATPQLEGTRPKVEYFTTFPTNHELQFTDTLGNDLPMILFESLPQVSQDALQNTDFGSANVPFKDANFDGNLEKAFI